MKNFFNKTGIWILAAAVVIVLTLSILSATGTGLLNNIAATIASPFRSAGAAIGNWFGSISDKFDSVEALQKENEELRKRVAQLEDANRQAETDSQENERLRNLLELRGFQTVAAGAFVGEHAFSYTLGKGRPDYADLSVASEFARRIFAVLRTGQVISPAAALR